jgi:hypothetical protein
MKKILALAVTVFSLSSYAGDYRQYLECKGINQYNQEVTAKLYKILYEKPENSNRALLILSGGTGTRVFQTVSTGIIKNNHFQDDADRVRMSLGGFLHHPDYYPLCGYLKCTEVKTEILLNND